MRQLAHLVLPRRRLDRIGQPAIGNDRVGGDFNLARRRHQPAAEVAERIQITRDRQRRPDAQVIGLDEVACTRRMHIEHQQHGSPLGKLIGKLEADAHFHE